MAGCFESGNEASGSVICREFVGSLRTGQLLKKHSAAWSE
jgi:hypothetical protein